MNKRFWAFAIAAVLVIALTILPTAGYRIRQDADADAYCMAVSVNDFATEHPEDLAAVLAELKEAGATVGLVRETESGYPAALLDAVSNVGMKLALAPNVEEGATEPTWAVMAQYPVKYLKPEASADGAGDPEKAAAIGVLLEKYAPTLVLSETKDQLSNQRPLGYEDYLEKADGRLIRCFQNRTNVFSEAKNYPYVYYQYFNSILERNTRFLLAVPLEDASSSVAENTAHNVEAIRLFTEKMNELGYDADGTVDLSGYPSHRLPVAAGCAALSVLLLGMMAQILFKKPIRYSLPLVIVAAAGAFGVTYLMPEQLLQFYPTGFAIIAACFVWTVLFEEIRWLKDQLGFLGLMPIMLLSAGLLMLLFGNCIAALMNGWKYQVYEQIFRGVKLSLSLPVVYAAAVLLVDYVRKEKKAGALPIRQRIGWGDVVLIVLVLIAGVYYLLRSGNMQITYWETWLRNGLTEWLVVRPRTKEFLLGWPCVMVLVYLAKKGGSRRLYGLAALVVSILVASVCNTFCHAVAQVKTMNIRMINGMLIGVLLGSLLLLFYHGLPLLFQRRKNH